MSGCQLAPRGRRSPLALTTGPARRPLPVRALAEQTGSCQATTGQRRLSATPPSSAMIITRLTSSRPAACAPTRRHWPASHSGRRFGKGAVAGQIGGPAGSRRRHGYVTAPPQSDGALRFSASRFLVGSHAIRLTHRPPPRLQYAGSRAAQATADITSRLRSLHCGGKRTRPSSGVVFNEKWLCTKRIFTTRCSARPGPPTAIPQNWHNFIFCSQAWKSGCPPLAPPRSLVAS